MKTRTELDKLLHDRNVELERSFYDWVYPKLTPEELAQFRRERGLK